MLAGAHIQVTITALFVHLVECGTLLMITRFSLLFNVFLFFIFWMAVAFTLLELFLVFSLGCTINYTALFSVIISYKVTGSHIYL